MRLLALPALPGLEPLELLVPPALLLAPPVLLLVLLVPLLAPAELALPEPLRRHTRQSARLTLPARPV